MSAGDEQQLVGRCYTRARKLPLVMGTWDGVRLWGGPYTVPQLVTMVVTLGLMVLAYPLWGHFGIANIVPLVGVPFALSFAVRRMRVEGRSPFAVAAGVVGLALSPRQGRVGGAPVKTPRPAPLRGSCTLTWRPRGGEAGPREAVPGRASDVLASAGKGGTPERAATAAAPGAGPATAPGADPGAGGRVLSGAGALLAAAREAGAGVRG